MILRVLPPEEWPRLEGTEAEKAWPYFDPENTRVLVVEEEGRIIGTWTALRLVHAECIWIAPEYRGSVGMVKRLLAGMRDCARAWKAKSVTTASQSDHVTDIITRLGGVPIPALTFQLPIDVDPEEQSCPQP